MGASFVKNTILICTIFISVMALDDFGNIIKNSVLKSNGFVRNKFKDLQTLKNPCTCAIFLEGQIRHDRRATPKGNPAFVKEMDISMYPCGLHGSKICTNKCLEMIIHNIPNAGPLICSSIERDCNREKAFLYTKNCDGTWHNTGISAGKEFCCVDGVEVKCQKRVEHHQPLGIISDLIDSTRSQSIPEIILNVADHAVDIASNVLRFPR